MITIICDWCGKSFKYHSSNRKYCNNKCYGKSKSLDFRNNNPNKNGHPQYLEARRKVGLAHITDNPTSRSYHHWIFNHYGRIRECELNSNHKTARFNWALLHHKEPSRDIRDYIKLCQSCHRLYDNGNKDIEKQVRIYLKHRILPEEIM